MSSLSFTSKYILALSLLFFLSILGYINLKFLVSSQSNDSKIINLSGKQRMLSQKINNAVLLFNIDVLNKNARIMEASHKYLTSLEMSSQINTIYFQEPINFNKKVKDYILNAKKVKQKNDLYSIYIIEESENLLNIFDKLTLLYQQEAEERINNINSFSTYIIIVSFILLFFIGFFIFKPANEAFEKRAREIIEEKDYSNIIIESNTNAIIAVGRDLKVRTFNKAAEKIFGYSKEEMIGENSLSKIVPLPYHKAHNAGISNHFEKGTFKYGGKNLELEAVRKNGEIFPINISFGENEDSKSTEKIVIANIQDMTEVKEKDKLIFKQLL